MQIGMIGLGRMGANLTRRLMRGGHRCVVHDRDSAPVTLLVSEGAEGATDLDDLLRRLETPRVVWLMLPAGAITETMVEALRDRMQPGDTIVDGGNTFYHDDVRRAEMLRARGIHYVDVGTSGGVWGLERGYCLMIGGETAVVERLDPIFRTLAPGRGQIPPTLHREGHDPRAEEGYLHCGPHGAGHFVKMIHNGIEYGLMQAFAEGFELLQGAGKPEIPAARRYELKLADIAEVWRRGSVISSWLLDLTAAALAENDTLSQYSGAVQDSGEGRWTIQTAIEEAVPANVLSAALYARFRSRQEHSFADRLLSAMRFQFGGHTEPPKR